MFIKPCFLGCISILLYSDNMLGVDEHHLSSFISIDVSLLRFIQLLKIESADKVFVLWFIPDKMEHWHSPNKGNKR